MILSKLIKKIKNVIRVKIIIIFWKKLIKKMNIWKLMMRIKKKEKNNEIKIKIKNENENMKKNIKIL